MARRSQSVLQELQWIHAHLHDLRGGQGRLINSSDEPRLRRSIRYYERKLEELVGGESG